MELIYREMTVGDYEAAYSLWTKTEGMVLSSADSKEEVEAYLLRNPGCSFVCEGEGELLGTILGGHDGRRGFIYHVAVSPITRGRGVGQRLVQQSLGRLREAGIAKCHLFVLEDNAIGGRFWARTGWQKREGILLFSKDT
ncbi:GNAT family N-acetyltransferase [Paenibacillus sp. OV219]|uniref:GNAT family N-acetyltransferase n=1 Tax=Paenibacillus sp. OV219 TaxID=1884377 RepID=UPI0008BCA931|nr:GNAT family N-acetyltransferase [Paenibacillus sp. OV219]SEO41683.1 Ribosomal protein S18 acetylase RimI [Paenibacillus sp. OV219]